MLDMRGSDHGICFRMQLRREDTDQQKQHPECEIRHYPLFDYVVWGADAGSDDNAAVWAGHWSDGEYVDTSQLLENQTIGRDKNSTDTDTPSDWENETDLADPFGIHRSTVNGSTPGACNVDFIIPEFSHGIVPVLSMIVIYVIYRKKSRKKYPENRKQKPQINKNNYF